MKRFSYDAVKSRLIKRMRMDSNSSTVLDDGAFGNLMDVFSEGISEVARYLEYALLEKKWKTAQNMSSLTSMGGLIGRKRQLAKSALGYVIVSHTDEEGVDRLGNYGSTFFDLDEASDYDDLEKNDDASYIEKSALVPWTNKSIYEVPKGTIFTSASGIQFISTKAVKSRILNTRYSVIKANSSRLEAFQNMGGWDGIKYLKIPVIQGIVKNSLLGTAKGTRFQTFSFSSERVENASNSVSKNYFYIKVKLPSSAEEQWAEIQNIRLAGPYDKVYEKKISEDGENIIIKFGDGITGAIPERNSSITVYYLETLGSEGNIEQKGQIITMSFPIGVQMIDPRTNMVSSFLNCTNTVAIMGGKDIEDEDDYKINAPSSYLSSYSTAVKAAYEKQILENSPLSLSKIICYPTKSFIAKQNDITRDEDLTEEVANELSIINNSLNISAIKSNGDKIEDSESEEFLATIVKSIGDSKGPNDSFIYTEPNFIKMAPSIKINTYDIDISESEIQSSIIAAVSSQYSIFNTKFKTPLYPSVLTHLASMFTFTDSVNLMVEALATVEMDADKMKYMNYKTNDGINRCLLGIPFSFDSVFASNQYTLGFKNAYADSPYLLKVDLTFKNTSSVTASGKKRTFFLFDNRVKQGQTLAEAYEEDLNNAKFKKLNVTVSNAEANVGRKIIFFDETKDNFNDRLVRVAQFPYITDITDESFMGNAKSFQTAPYENRPYEVDTLGKNMTFKASEVDSSLAIGLGGEEVDSSSSTTSVYKKNSDYIDYVDIIFNENYDDPDSLEYANGYIIIPVDFFSFDLPSYNSKNPSASDYITPLAAYLNSYVEFKVYAIPKMSNIEPENYNDICFIDDDDIKVKKVLKIRD